LRPARGENESGKSISFAVVGLAVLGAGLVAAVSMIDARRARGRVAALESELAAARVDLREASRERDGAAQRSEGLQRELDEERRRRQDAEAAAVRRSTAAAAHAPEAGAQTGTDDPASASAARGFDPAGPDAVNGWTREAVVAWLQDLAPRKFATLDPDELDSVLELAFENGTIDDEDLDAIALLTSLQSLELAGQPITDAGLERLRGHPALRHLDLSGTRVTPEGIAAVAGPELKALHLDHLDWSDEDMAGLPPMQGLLQLKLNRTSIGDDAALAFPSLPELRHLELDGTAFTARGLADLLARCPSLHRIEARGTGITREDLRDVLRDYPNVEVVLEQGGVGIRIGQLER